MVFLLRRKTLLFFFYLLFFFFRRQFSEAMIVFTRHTIAEIFWTKYRWSKLSSVLTLVDRFIFRSTMSLKIPEFV